MIALQTIFQGAKLNQARTTITKIKKYITATINSSKFKTYKDVQISYKTNDTKYILLDISGIVNKEYRRRY